MLLVVGGLFAVALTRTGAHNSPPSAAPNGNSAAEKANHSDEVVLACPGRVEGLSEVIKVSAAVDGVLAAVRVKEGQRVAAGEVLALIDCHDLEAELQAARARAESARQSRQRILRGSREEERHMAADKLVEAEAVLRQAQLQSQRIAALFDKGDVSREALEKARRDAEVAEATRRAAANYQTLVNAPPLPEETARADAEVNAAEEQIRISAAKLNKCTIKAPLAGTVLQSHLKPGEAVSAVFPQPIVSLADTSQLRVRAEVDERDIGRIYSGQPALILIDAFPQEQFRGSVSSLGALMGRKKVRTGDPAEKSDRDVLEVLVDLAKTDERLVIGLRTTVQFLAGRETSVNSPQGRNGNTSTLSTTVQ
jgi:ABC exporter DevB family membrane fusion protein